MWPHIQRAGARSTLQSGRPRLPTMPARSSGDLPAAAVDTGLVLKVLEPIWTAKHETARRLRARIESVLDWAKVRGYRSGENPARWKGHLSESLAKPANVHVVKHHPALPYSEVPELIAELRARDDRDARALELSYPDGFTRGRNYRRARGRVRFGWADLDNPRESNEAEGKSQDHTVSSAVERRGGGGCPTRGGERGTALPPLPRHVPR